MPSSQLPAKGLVGYAPCAVCVERREDRAQLEQEVGVRGNQRSCQRPQRHLLQAAQSAIALDTLHEAVAEWARQRGIARLEPPEGGQ